MSRGLNNDTSTPRVQRTMLRKLRDSSRRCIARRSHHRARRRRMKAPQMRVAQGERNRRARAHVLRKLRVIRGRERLAVTNAPLARRCAERAFRRDMNRVGIELREQCGQAPIREPGQANFRIRRARKRAELIWLDHPHVVPAGRTDRPRSCQRLDDAIGLRSPGVGDDRNLHAARSSERRIEAAGVHDDFLAFSPAQQREAALEIFGQRRAAFDPVAVVAVEHAVMSRDLGAMDVAADRCRRGRDASPHPRAPARNWRCTRPRSSPCASGTRRSTSTGSQSGGGRN